MKLILISRNELDIFFLGKSNSPADHQVGSAAKQVTGFGGGVAERYGEVEWVHGELIERSASCAPPCICWDAVNPVWGSGGHEPPAPEQEASPQGQLLALKGPTHP